MEFGLGSEIGILAVTAGSIGFVHTVTGPDHYLPFIVLGRARRWPLARTLGITAICGVGHVLGSVVLGLIGIGLGLAIGRLEIIEGVRGDLASWLLISFGLAYTAWGLRSAYRDRPHSHRHVHADGTVHEHHHSHRRDHSHPHDARNRSLTAWALFVIFVLGPCEPLIPILMYPAADASMGGLVLVVAVFSVATIVTMMAMVLMAERGLRLVKIGGLERYAHAFAGVAILGSGLAIRLLGL